MKRLRGLGLVSAAIAVLVLGVASPASAATLQGKWDMDATGSTVPDLIGAADISLTGPWSEVTGTAAGTGKAIHFEYDAATSTPAVGEISTGSSVFNPGTGPFAVTAQIRTDTAAASGSSPNIVQKGLSSDPGQWKMQLQLVSGVTIASCRFMGDLDSDLVRDSTNTPINDGNWHKVTCWRLPGDYGITVDGTATSPAVVKTLGTITNIKPVRLGNKTVNANATDQFTGDIDCLVYVDGSSPRTTAVTNSPC